MHSDVGVEVEVVEVVPSTGTETGVSSSGTGTAVSSSGRDRGVSASFALVRKWVPKQSNVFPHLGQVVVSSWSF